jgi:hypothetical protein
MKLFMNYKYNNKIYSIFIHPLQSIFSIKYILSKFHPELSVSNDFKICQNGFIWRDNKTFLNEYKKNVDIELEGNICGGNFFTRTFLSAKPLNLNNSIYNNFDVAYSFIKIFLAFVYAISFFMFENLVKNRSDNIVLNNLDNNKDIINNNVYKLKKTNPELFRNGSNMFVNFTENNYLRIPSVAIDMSNPSLTEIYFTGGLTIYLVTIIITTIIMMNTAIYYNHPNFFSSLLLFIFFISIPFILFILIKFIIKNYEKLNFLHKIPKYYFTDYSSLYLIYILSIFFVLFIIIIAFRKYILNQFTISWYFILLSIFIAIIIFASRYILYYAIFYISLFITRLFGVIPYPHCLRDSVVAQFIFFIIVLPFLGIIIFNIVGYFTYKMNKTDIDYMNNNIENETILNKIKNNIKKVFKS